MRNGTLFLRFGVWLAVSVGLLAGSVVAHEYGHAAIHRTEGYTGDYSINYMSGCVHGTNWGCYQPASDDVRPDYDMHHKVIYPVQGVVLVALCVISFLIIMPRP